MLSAALVVYAIAMIVTTPKSQGTSHERAFA
jgi:hypothetical protein